MRLPMALCAVLCVSSSAAAQQAPPIQGVTGTIATDGTIRSEHKAAQQGGGGREEDPPRRQRRRVRTRSTRSSKAAACVVRDVADSGDALKTTTQGVVIDVNRSRKQITIRSADKKTHTLRVMDASAASTAGAHVVVSLEDQAGRQDLRFQARLVTRCVPRRWSPATSSAGLQACRLGRT